ncbi:hypothetical protein MMUR_46970 [Mycolicibacterium murale]|jgi:uncharacterized protein (DUF58 family)|uniref:DUF58 domain-containing protein n=1 Tax=Mycolicibacterium murale TaxID=182220 RepID=A0A7I9WS38_9MYCO|nr:DUF58 domain-containing protein [Mycolicibacterium murale]MCV7186325.1 DUF58 domain-containing protein [Mycolicibacterium murale]GFG60561.1 hypothetical protein MMUR_46970 [Mycolicibacterium murale]
MGRHLQRARSHFGTDTRGMLDGGRYALLHTRTLELDELRPYLPGDDVRDIDWKASARSTDVLVKRFVSEQHHKIVLVADAGRNVGALAPGGEVKRDVAVTAMGAVGLIALARSDEVGLVYGDGRGAVSIRSRRGEAHIESLLERYYTHGTDSPSDIGTQLAHVARAHRSRLLVIVVSDEPDVTPALEQALQRLSGRHEVLWLLTPDMPALGGDDLRDGFDVATGRFVLGAATLGARVAEAYRAAEERRTVNLNNFLTANRIPFARIGASGEIRSALTQLSQVYRHAG